jgi:adenylate kinase family enzyme
LAVRRVSVVGASGAGKTTFARRLAALLDVTFFELDEVHNRAGWTHPDDEEFTSIAERMASTESWVIDGNYRVVTMHGPVWARADTVVFLDRRRPVVMRQLVTRSVQRIITGAELWNGNRETWGDLLSLDRQRSVIIDSALRHTELRDRYLRAMCDPAYAHLDFVRLTSRHAAQDFLDDRARR